MEQSAMSTNGILIWVGFTFAYMLHKYEYPLSFFCLQFTLQRKVAGAWPLGICHRSNLRRKESTITSCYRVLQLCHSSSIAPSQAHKKQEYDVKEGIRPSKFYYL